MPHIWLALVVAKCIAHMNIYGQAYIACKQRMMYDTELICVFALFTKTNDQINTRPMDSGAVHHFEIGPFDLEHRCVFFLPILSFRYNVKYKLYLIKLMICICKTVEN